MFSRQKDRKSTAPYDYIMSSLPVPDKCNRVPQLCPTVNIQNRPVPLSLCRTEAILRGQDKRAQPFLQRDDRTEISVIDRMLQVASPIQTPVNISCSCTSPRNVMQPIVGSLGFDVRCASNRMDNIL